MTRTGTAYGHLLTGEPEDFTYADDLAKGIASIAEAGDHFHIEYRDFTMGDPAVPSSMVTEKRWVVSIGDADRMAKAPTPWDGCDYFGYSTDREEAIRAALGGYWGPVEDGWPAWMAGTLT